LATIAFRLPAIKSATDAENTWPAMPIAATPVAQKIVCPETRDGGRYQGVRKILPQGFSDITGIKF
jgi:hypothetical protein